MKTLLEAAKAVMVWADTPDVNNNSERTGTVAALRSAIKHEADERRDFERLLMMVPDDTAASEVAEQILWRRKARAEQGAVQLTAEDVAKRWAPREWEQLAEQIRRVSR